MLASIFSDPAILGAHKEGLGRHGAGPHLVNETLVAYLEAERALGRIRDDVDLPAAAGLLLGACFQHAFLDHMSPAGTHRASADPAATYASTLLPALLP
jgi:hypothetical protein